MSEPQAKSSHIDAKTIHPGSSAEEARMVGGKGDFGVPESNVAERTYTSRNTKLADRGAAPAHSGADGSRTSGVGGNNSGVGSSSGGDLDTDIIGLGTGGGIAASGKIHEPAGPDDAAATNHPGKSSKVSPSAIRPARRDGSTVQQADANSTSANGADSATPAIAENDSFVGEISTSEADGRDDLGE